MPRTYKLLRPGVVRYDAAVELMRLLEQKAREQERAAFLVLLEHMPVITIGKNGRESNVLLPVEALERRGLDVRRVDRGGDVTWHGPGQLVGYPVIHLRGRRLSVKQYVHGLEEVMIRVARRFDVGADRKEGCVGVWVRERKVGALGVRVRRHVTTHGFALNVSNDLSAFSSINPCGVPGGAVTSLSAEVGREVSMPLAIDAAARAFEEVFDFAPSEGR